MHGFKTVREYMKLYDLIVIDYNHIRIEYPFNSDLINLIFSHNFLYYLYIHINNDHLYCKFIKKNKSII
jgi:hypothetical protein